MLWKRLARHPFGAGAGIDGFWQLSHTRGDPAFRDQAKWRATRFGDFAARYHTYIIHIQPMARCTAHHQIGQRGGESLHVLRATGQSEVRIACRGWIDAYRILSYCTPALQRRLSLRW